MLLFFAFSLHGRPWLYVAAYHRRGAAGLRVSLGAGRQLYHRDWYVSCPLSRPLQLLPLLVLVLLLFLATPEHFPGWAVGASLNQFLLLEIA